MKATTLRVTKGDTTRTHATSRLGTDGIADLGVGNVLAVPQRLRYHDIFSALQLDADCSVSLLSS